MGWDWALLFLTGLLAGTLGSVAGLGGGIVVVPSLLYFSNVLPAFSHVTPTVATGTALIIVLLTGLSSTLSYAKQRRVDYRSGLLFFLGSGPGAWAGANFSRYLSTEVFYILFGVLIITMALVLKGRNKRGKKQINWKVQRSYTDAVGERYEYGYSPALAITISFFIGLVAGLFGIGGGLLFVPLMLLMFRFPPHLATATSMFVIFLSSTTGSITHIALGHVDWWAVLWLAPGAWIGAAVGAALSKRISGPLLITMLQIIFTLLGLRMIWDGIWG